MNTISIGNPIDLQTLISIVNEKNTLKISEKAIQDIEKCRQYLDEKLSKENKAFYGINTGFGSLCNTVVSNEKLEELQYNLLCSHACGMGEFVPEEIVKLMLLLKIQSLSQGNSGVQLETVNRLTDFYNHDIIPVIYTQGSLGASGDLSPLSHLCLPLLGEGEIWKNGKITDGKEANISLQKKDVTLKSKEGLALINGTQFMSAYASWCLVHAKKILHLADLIAAMSIDAFDGRIEPFDAKIGKLRPHAGHIETSQNICKFLEGSEIIKQAKTNVQDPYSFRCIPQVHGASKDAIRHAEQVILTEINAVTDNPNIFPDEDEIISAGNFHGQPLALILDYMAIALAEIGSISERRTYLLISGQRNLPPFLAENPGLNSGFMIPQYTAASIVSQNKQLCTPASIDSITSSNGQEDHVSMGANAATKLYKIVENLYAILGIELLNAAQALEFRRPKKSSPIIEKLLADFRKDIAYTKEDGFMHPKMKKAKEFLMGI